MGKDERERVCVEWRKWEWEWEWEWEEGYRGGKGEVRGRRKDTKEKCAFERVCMKDCLIQSLKNIEPPIHQMTCDLKSEENGNVLSCRNLFVICH